MQIYAISDVHGHFEALERALEKIDLSGNNRLIFLGDYIDGGPESGQVLRRVFELQKTHGPKKVVALRGNHEEMLLEWLDAYAGPKAGQPDEYGLIPWSEWLELDEDLETFRTLVSPEQLAFFKTVLPTLSENSRNMEAAEMVLSANSGLISWLRGLPYFYETEKQIFVHAGVDEEAGAWWPRATTERIFTQKFPASTGSFCKDIIAGHIGTGTLAHDPTFHGVYYDGASHYYIDGSIQMGGQINVLMYETGTEKYRWLSPGNVPGDNPNEFPEKKVGLPEADKDGVIALLEKGDRENARLFDGGHPRGV